MIPGSTLFLAVCAQRDFWPGGAWPLVDAAAAHTITELYALGAALGVRQGGICCRHTSDAPAHAGPPHCLAGTAGEASLPRCVPAASVLLVDPGATLAPALDRAHAYCVASGCVAAVDAEPAGRLVFEHLAAGIRDAVVFGAGVELGIARAVDALLRRRVRTHVVLDAAAPADPAEAQQVIAEWKRRGVDGATASTIARLLRRAAPP
jgi:nicotinamidase-related amidase